MNFKYFLYFFNAKYVAGKRKRVDHQQDEAALKLSVDVTHDKDIDNVFTYKLL